MTKQAGIVFIPVEHTGNSQGSVEEAEVIRQVVNEMRGRALHKGKDGTRPIKLDDMLFVAPYNLQVANLKKVLSDDARVASVDIFQGQEAPIVVISLCASDANESPRGMDFLLNKNRLNVALSRGQCLTIVVGSPGLAYSTATSLKQMGLISLFCSLMEAGEA